MKVTGNKAKHLVIEYINNNYDLLYESDIETLLKHRESLDVDKFYYCSKNKIIFKECEGIEKVIKSRGAGKSSELIGISSRNYIPIASRNYNTIKDLRHQAIAYKLDMPDPITYRELLNRRGRSKDTKEVLIDDLEYFLEELEKDLNIKIKAISLSPEKEI